MQISKLRVTVAIPAYNEEGNIKNLVGDVLSQRKPNFELVEVIVLSDGSRDGTVFEAKQIKSPRVRVIDGKKRLGKPARLNEIFGAFKGNVLVLLDADVRLASKNTIASLVKPFEGLGLVGMTSGMAVPQKGRNLLEEAVNVSVETYLKYAEKINGGQTIYAVEGRVLALSAAFAKEAWIPQNTYGTDAYLYFLAKSKGYGFCYVKQAAVLYRSPSRIAEQYRQNLRFAASQHKMKKFFGSLAASEYRGKKVVLYRLMLAQFLKKPVASLLVFAVNSYCKARAGGSFGKMGAMWEVALTTKGGANV